MESETPQGPTGLSGKDRAYDLDAVQKKLQSVKTLSDLSGPGGPIQELMKQAVERILKAEQQEHLGYAPYDKGEEKVSNSRNGYSKKTLKTSSGPVEIAVPRDREGSFEPQFLQKHRRTDPHLEGQITGLYARGMSTRDIQSQLEEFYGTSVSPMLITRVTDQLLDGIRQWQERPLDDVYPVVFLDAIHYKIRQDSKVISKAAYTCLGISLDGKVDVLGLWLGEAEGARFWLSVLTELKARGVKDILIACVDGLKGFPEAIGAVFPKTAVQLCIVHQIRASLRYLAYKHQREFVADLKQIYRAPSRDLAETQLARLEEKWQSRYPSAVNGWKANWENLATFFDYPIEIRRMIYTTNAVEALHRQFRKVTKTKGAFPTDDALKKMLYLATLGLSGSFRSKLGWPPVLGQLRIIFGDRIPEKSV